MSIEHEAVIVDGERVGDLITIDCRVIFFTTRPDFQHLDGRIFDTMDDAWAVVRWNCRIAAGAAS